VSTYLDATHALTPTAATLVGTVVTHPERGIGSTLDWVAQFLATAPDTHRLALLDALFQAVRVLEHAHTEITGLAPAAGGPIEGDDVPSDFADGSRDATDALTSDALALHASGWIGYANGAVSNVRYAGAVATLCVYGADLVHSFAQAASADVRAVWADLLPVLSDPVD
jgi:hypothetical protein